MKFGDSLSAGGQLILRRVEGEMTVAPLPGGKESWNGQLNLLSGEHIRTGYYTLTLDEGRTGEIDIRGKTTNSSGTVATFTDELSVRPPTTPSRPSG